MGNMQLTNRLFTQKAALPHDDLVPDPQCLSLFEKLPKELIQQIFDYVPGCVFQLRLTSRLLKVLVDEYASLRPNTQLVEELTFTYTGWESVNAPQISALVPKSKAAVFELRLFINLRVLLFDFDRKIKRSFHESRNDHNVYKLPLDLRITEDCLLLTKGMGSLISKATLYNCNGQQLAMAAKRLDKIKFRKLDVMVEELSEYDSSVLLTIVRLHNFDHLSLCVRNVSVPTANNFLELASLVRSLYIAIYVDSGIRAWKPHNSLRNSNIGWVPFILKMFASKLEVLRIENHGNTEYLSTDETKTLREKLPLLGKQVWFNSTCAETSEGFKTTVNGHIVEIFPNPHAQYLSALDPKPATLIVKHSSKLDETFPKFGN